MKSMDKKVSDTQRDTLITNMVALLAVIIAAVALVQPVISAFQEITLSNTERMDEMRREYDNKYELLKEEYEKQVDLLQKDIRRLEDELSEISKKKGINQNMMNIEIE